MPCSLTQLCPILCNTMDCSPPGSSDSPGKNTGVGSRFLLQRIFLTLRLCPVSPALAGGFFTTEPPWYLCMYIYICVCIYIYIFIHINNAVFLLVEISKWRQKIYFNILKLTVLFKKINQYHKIVMSLKCLINFYLTSFLMTW